MKPQHFRREFGGYCAQEVDDYLQQLEQEYDEKIGKQNDQMFQMRQEIYNLNGEIEQQRINADKMSRALELTMQKANELSKLSHNVYDLEVQRMRLLYGQWVGLLEKFKQRFSSIISEDDIQNVIGDFQKSLTVTINSQIKDDSENVFSQSYVSTISNQAGGRPTHEEEMSFTYTTANSSVSTSVKSTSNNGKTLADLFLSGEDVGMPESFGETGPNMIPIPGETPVVHTRKFDMKDTVNPEDCLGKSYKR
ncbi:MAG: DivIVA domain-containing protein [Clostridia bacterium]|nr:DivIVA domain-containing protein [Clostridia bacterium]